MVLKHSTEIFNKFPTTFWPMVVRAGQKDSESQRNALEELLRRYLPVLRYYLISSRKVRRDKADDLLQGFVCNKVIEQKLIRKANQNRGKFRTFLFTAFQNYIVSEYRQESAQKRGKDLEIPLKPMSQFNDSIPTHELPDQFNLAWAREVLTKTLQRMEADCRQSGRDDIWCVFEKRVVTPIIKEVEPMPYEEIIRQFSFQSPTQAFNVLTTGKRMFHRLLRQIVGEYVENDSEIEAEIQELKRILSGMHA
jgi:RNA polymerase sigma-70 factor (ECF subfamily)